MGEGTRGGNYDDGIGLDLAGGLFVFLSRKGVSRIAGVGGQAIPASKGEATTTTTT